MDFRLSLHTFFRFYFLSETQCHRLQSNKKGYSKIYKISNLPPYVKLLRIPKFGAASHQIESVPLLVTRVISNEDSFLASVI